jgi:hypothetical protein
MYSTVHGDLIGGRITSMTALRRFAVAANAAIAFRGYVSLSQQEQQQQCDNVEATMGELPAHASTEQSAPYACYIATVSSMKRNKHNALNRSYYSSTMLFIHDPRPPPGRVHTQGARESALKKAKAQTEKSVKSGEIHYPLALAFY